MTAVDDLPYFVGRPGAVFFPPALSGEIEMLNTSLLMLNCSTTGLNFTAVLPIIGKAKTISFRICWKLTEIMPPITFSKTNWSSGAVPKA